LLHDFLLLLCGQFPAHKRIFFAGGVLAVVATEKFFFTGFDLAVVKTEKSCLQLMQLMTLPRLAIISNISNYDISVY
jgi:hypothetical protein